MHPQTLRKYERLGLVRPARTIGSMRLYSTEEIERLRFIKRLVEEDGVNLAGAPDIPGRKTAALSSYRKLAPQAFAPVIAGSFAQLLAAWRRSEPVSLAEAWMARAHPVGTVLEVHGGQGEISRGRFMGIEPDGAMRLLHEDGTTSLVRAGDVQLG